MRYLVCVCRLRRYASVNKPPPQAPPLGLPDSYDREGTEAPEERRKESAAPTILVGTQFPSVRLTKESHEGLPAEEAKCEQSSTNSTVDIIFE